MSAWYGPQSPQVVIVGEAPSKWMQESGSLNALLNSSLEDLCGLSLHEFAERFGRVNLLSNWPGRQGKKGDAFPMAIATERADIMAFKLEDIPKVVLLGRRVQTAFRLDGELDFFEWVSHPVMRSVCIAPHPSRVSRWWNEQTNRQKAQAFWSKLAREA